MNKFRKIPSFDFEGKEYVSAEDFIAILDEIEQRVNKAVDNMDEGFRYLPEVYDELEELSNDLY